MQKSIYIYGSVCVERVRGGSITMLVAGFICRNVTSAPCTLQGGDDDDYDGDDDDDDDDGAANVAEMKHGMGKTKTWSSMVPACKV